MKNIACITGCAPKSIGEGFLDVLNENGFSCTVQWRNKCTEHQNSSNIQNTLASHEEVEAFVTEVKTKITNIGLLILAHGGYSNNPDVDMRWSDLQSRILIARGLLDVLSPEGKIVIIGSRHGEETFDKFHDKKLPRQREYAQIYRDIKGIPGNSQYADIGDRVVIPIVGGAMTSGLQNIAKLLEVDADKLQMTTPDYVAAKTLEFIGTGAIGSFQIK